MTIRENLKFPLRRHTKKFGTIKRHHAIGDGSLGKRGLAHTHRFDARKLSGGMKTGTHCIGENPDFDAQNYSV